jgi:hypothetical protein
VPSENLRLDHPIPIAAQFSRRFRSDKLRKYPPACFLCFRVVGQGQPSLLGFTECRLGRSQLGAQSIHLHMVMGYCQRLSDFVSLSLQFDHVLLRLAEETVRGH